MKILLEYEKQPNIVDYIAQPLSKIELKDILQKLNLPASSIVRKNDANADLKAVNWDDEEIALELLSKHPELLERPIIVKGKEAVLGRPPENVRKLFSGTSS